jgi:hypothetical protein
MRGSPFDARCFDLGLEFCCGQRRFGERTQPICGIEQLAYTSAPDLFAQQWLQSLWFQDSQGLCLPR